LIPGFIALIKSSLNERIITPKTTVFVAIKSFLASPPGAAEALAKFCDINKTFGNMASPPRAAEALGKN
jgi:hypothetical protein